ncbi:hypothetical protein [Streptomyces hainanensis]|uniref:Uncharacterized protein n=1 Tax=Streptomyces hainanensis TaxID=402648 RepID=A0A4R4TP20_9ACTN|nr:hypothetical protein [Streptomyces hainanensis]TDC77654.1 hypothetical protein E1283_06795 [Streptomyces hainanensis]
MQHRPLRGTLARVRSAASGTSRWLARRRAIAAHQFLRGASYAAGTTVVGLLVVWFQARH